MYALGVYSLLAKAEVKVSLTNQVFRDLQRRMFLWGKTMLKYLRSPIAINVLGRFRKAVRRDYVR